MAKFMESSALAALLPRTSVSAVAISCISAARCAWSACGVVLVRTWVIRLTEFTASPLASVPRTPGVVASVMASCPACLTAVAVPLFTAARVESCGSSASISFEMRADASEPIAASIFVLVALDESDCTACLTSRASKF